MAKTVALEWGAFMRGETVEKRKRAEVNVETRKRSVIPTVASLAVTGAVIALKCATMAHTAPVAVPVMAAVSAVSTVAGAVQPAGSANFSTQLAAATQPIKDIIFGFAGEIYFVFMAWGALEALIGKPAQGFARMKVATGAYILLYWVPWIVSQVNHVRPTF